MLRILSSGKRVSIVYGLKKRKRGGFFAPVRQLTKSHQQTIQSQNDIDVKNMCRVFCSILLDSGIFLLVYRLMCTISMNYVVS
jgi:hypothetical protein